MQKEKSNDCQASHVLIDARSDELLKDFLK